MFLLLLAYGINDFLGIYGGKIKSIISTDKHFKYNNQTLALSDLKDFNFGFGIGEELPLKYGKYYAEHITNTRIGDTKKIDKKSKPLKLIPCKDDKEWHDYYAAQDDSQDTYEWKLEGLMCSDGFRKMELTGSYHNKKF